MSKIGHIRPFVKAVFMSPTMSIKWVRQCCHIISFKFYNGIILIGIQSSNVILKIKINANSIFAIASPRVLEDTLVHVFTFEC
jgi:hypothetical protein